MNKHLDICNTIPFDECWMKKINTLSAFHAASNTRVSEAKVRDQNKLTYKYEIIYYMYTQVYIQDPNTVSGDRSFRKS